MKSQGVSQVHIVRDDAGMRELFPSDLITIRLNRKAAFHPFAGEESLSCCPVRRTSSASDFSLDTSQRSHEDRIRPLCSDGTGSKSSTGSIDSSSQALSRSLFFLEAQSSHHTIVSSFVSPESIKRSAQHTLIDGGRNRKSKTNASSLNKEKKIPVNGMILPSSCTVMKEPVRYRVHGETRNNSGRRGRNGQSENIIKR
eukprot:scaffold814_cov100-Cylindrotheca_fusiformis.AAC.8